MKPEQLDAVGSLLVVVGYILILYYIAAVFMTADTVARLFYLMKATLSALLPVVGIIFKILAVLSRVKSHVLSLDKEISRDTAGAS